MSPGRPQVPVLSVESDLPGDASDKHMERVFALWHSVLLRAIADWTMYRNSKDLRSQMIWKSAARWLFGPDDQYFNSFSSICQLLGWDPSVARDRIRSLTVDDIERIRSRRR